MITNTNVKALTIKSGNKLYYWDHGHLRSRVIMSVSLIDTRDNMEYRELRQLRERLHRSNIPRYVVDVTFDSNPDKHILMCCTSINGQWSTGTMYYWSSLYDWTFHQELRELKMNDKIDRALLDIAYARKQLESISDKFRTVRTRIII